MEFLFGAREYRCCRELEPVVGKMMVDGSTSRCVCDHKDFVHITYRQVLLLSGSLLRGQDGKPYKQHGKTKTSENE